MNTPKKVNKTRFKEKLVKELQLGIIIIVVISLIYIYLL